MREFHSFIIVIIYNKLYRRQLSSHLANIDERQLVAWKNASLCRCTCFAYTERRHTKLLISTLKRLEKCSHRNRVTSEHTRFHLTHMTSGVSTNTPNHPPAAHTPKCPFIEPASETPRSISF